MDINIAILGVGRWGSHFINILQQNPSVNLRAIVDPNSSTLEHCQKKYNINSEQVKLLNNWEEIKNIPDLNTVIITTPAITHYNLIKSLLENNYHILSEKPLTTNSLECIELTQLAESKNLQLFIDHTYLFNPLIHRAKEIVDSGKLGNLKYAYASRTHLDAIRQDVDVIWDLAIHDISMFNFLLNQKPLKVRAEGQYWLRENLADVAWLKLYYPDDFIVTIHVSWLNHDKQRKLTVVGEKSSLIFDEMSPQSPLVLQGGEVKDNISHITVENRSTEVINHPPFNTLQLMCDRFLDNVKHNHQDQISGGNLATDLVRILEALSLSLQNNGQLISIIDQK